VVIILINQFETKSRLCLFRKFEYVILSNQVKIFINKNSKITKAMKSCFMAQSNEELFYEISTHRPLQHPIQKKITPKRPLKGSFLTFCMEDCLLKFAMPLMANPRDPN
jgi:hypothetical protein